MREPKPAPFGSELHRERQSASAKRAHKITRDASLIRLRDLQLFGKPQFYANRKMQPLIAAAEVEYGEILNALGGPEECTPQQRALVQDFCSCGIALRALVRFMVQNAPEVGSLGDVASRIGSLSSARRGLIALLGLQRYQKDAIDPRRPIEVVFGDSDTEATP
ncbi:MAG TPA: hypothetical protein VK714_21490 [Myxococcota bacterium]|nr:hypothetical protein [Myxococcota bacterium]